MSHKKKSRATGYSDVIIVRQRSEADQLGRDLKKQKKQKGLKSGNRHSDETEGNKLFRSKAPDPRIGSKKKIPLIVEAPKKLSKQERREKAENELAILENDTQFNVLLDRLEQGEKLGEGLQNYVDEKLNRIEKLMKQLGLYEDEEDDVERIERPKKRKESIHSEDDLLAKFEKMDISNLDS